MRTIRPFTSSALPGSRARSSSVASRLRMRARSLLLHPTSSPGKAAGADPVSRSLEAHYARATAAAGVTRGVRIGTAVVPLYTRALPVHAAAAGSVAQLAPGRFVLGLGVSSETIVATWGGVPFERPLARMRESVAVLRRMLAGERV